MVSCAAYGFETLLFEVGFRSQSGAHTIVRSNDHEMDSIGLVLVHKHRKVYLA